MHTKIQNVREQTTRAVCIRLTVVFIVLLFCGLPTFAQGSQISGIVTDPAGAVVPNAEIVIVNQATNVERRIQTNEAGEFIAPFLEIGTYVVRVSKSGFSTAVSEPVVLHAAEALSVPMRLNVGAASETVTVKGGGGLLLDTTQSQLAPSIPTSQIQELPILNRNFTGLVLLLPGVRVNTTLPTKATMGSITFGSAGAPGWSVIVDGAENRDDLVGGALQSYTNEGIEEFALLTHSFTAEYTHSYGAILNVVTKSGSNEFHGTAFAQGRDAAMTATDYFTRQSGASKLPFNREQYGGSFGGPIKKDRVFFSIAMERPQFDTAVTVPIAAYNQMAALATLVSFVPNVGTPVVPVQRIPQSYRDLLSQARVDATINPRHSLAFRFSDDNNVAANDQYTNGNTHDLSAPTTDENSLYSGVASWTWLVSPTKVNKFTFQYSHDWNIIGFPNGCFPSVNTPKCPQVIDTVNFPAFSTGQAAFTGQNNRQNKLEGKEDYTALIGRHSLKLGADFMYFLEWGGYEVNGAPGTISFFANPSVILSSYQQWQANPGGCTTATCGLYPHGLSTIGAVSGISETSNNVGDYHTPHVKELGEYIQDDWKVKPGLTLNLGFRYDRSYNFYNTSEMPRSPIYTILKAIGSPYGTEGVVQDPKHDFQPRIGFAWDPSGSGKQVLRGGFGIFSSVGVINNYFSANVLNKTSLFLLESFPNTGSPGTPGSGIFSTFQYGVSALPPVPNNPTSFLPGASTSPTWVDPKLHDAYSEQFHIGYSRSLSDSTTILVDYVHSLALHVPGTLGINPIENAWDPTANPANYGKRRFAPLTQAVYGDPNLLGGVTLDTSINRERFDEVDIQFQHRFHKNSLVRVSYTYSRDYTYQSPLNQDQLIAPSNFGPVGSNQPHTVNVFGVFNLWKGIEVSPILQASAARHYTLTEGIDINKDGTNNERYVNPATGNMVPIGSQKGDAFFLLDLRGTKFFNLGKEGARRLGLYVELYNVTNRANFGNTYNGNCAAQAVGGPCTNASFETPVGYIPGLNYSRQVQLGGRFIF